MAKQNLILGVMPTGIGGDDSRTGSEKINSNFDEVYAALGAPTSGQDKDVIPAALPLNKGGTGATTAAVARANLGLGTAATLNSDSFVRTGNMLYLESSQASGMYVYAPSVKPSGLTLGHDYGVVIKASHEFVGTRAEICLPHNAGVTGSLVYRSATTMPWRRVRDTINTTIDANGFIKNASPIVELHADKIELNDEAKLQNIEFEKLGVGDYLVKGSTGLSNDGWYVEQPRDANGNLYHAVVYEQLENNDISVKTYKRKFDIETASIVADLENPTDIPEGRWIDIRLQELPQPEVESESIAPPDFQPTNLSEAVHSFMAGGGYVSE